MWTKARVVEMGPEVKGWSPGRKVAPDESAILARICLELQVETLRVASKALQVLAEVRTLWSKLGRTSKTPGGEVLQCQNSGSGLM